MTSTSDRLRTTNNHTNEWIASAVTTDNPRKAQTATIPITNDSWQAEPATPSLRYSIGRPNLFQRTERASITKLSAGKTSEDSTEAAGNTIAMEMPVIHEPHAVQLTPSVRSPTYQEDYWNRLGNFGMAAVRRLPRYPEEDAAVGVNMSQAMIAMQKLQKLKELQRKRDLTERYYSQEIRRLIGDHYNGSGLSQFRKPGEECPVQRKKQPCAEEHVKVNVLKTVEPCGTMTTITRLDCGCVQETTRPIFTTSRGRVQKRNCDVAQDPVVLKLTSSNPQEHLHSLLDTSSKGFHGAFKGRRSSLVDSSISPKIPGHDYDSVPHRISSLSSPNTLRKPEIPKRYSPLNLTQPRGHSPLRRFNDADTSSDSH
ncbi:uncharacterized protein LOC107271672 [Cephus cinctus]|uniref:Uncharacterized protein LOC107271672 n=1 Tax=Cephus cinctus TaxID=211228 RepID=A0AAJ7RPK3_CEPCN|nr:uncharacterized protein LOC107271672 [Cephus cinctus]XP_024944756.1 uncharacterized protein LOC107271672 [Cephus cinctus]